MKKNIQLALSSALLLSTTLYAGDNQDITALKEQVKSLQNQMEVLIDETSDLQTGFSYTTLDSKKSHSGLGSAASKVYYSESPLSVGGYGEMYYAHTNKEDGTNSDVTEVKRFITYFGHKFTDNIILNSEIEYEGGGVTASGGGDEVIVEFMYIDFLQNNNFNARVGNMLMPIGLINEHHEPTLFTTVQRPATSKYIIPTTWHESGVMAYGDIVDGVEYKIAAVSAVQPDDNAGVKWFREGRGGSSKVNNVSLATVARVDYTGINGLLAGASIYVDKDITLMDTHVDYKRLGARLYGTYAQTHRSGVTSGATQVTDSYGGYLNASFDLLSLTNNNMKLPLFAQYENYNAQDKRADDTSGDDTTNVSFGLNFFPHPQVVFKTDYVLSTTHNSTDKIASVSMGFIF